MTEQLPIDNNELEDLFYPIPYESLFEIDFPEELPVYEGGGATSYKRDYDGDKIEFMDKLGIEMPDSWQDDRGFIVSGFITLQYILAWERARRDNIEDENLPKEYYFYIINKLNNHRIDEDGDRKITSSGKRFSAYLEQGNASSNPTKKLSKRELAAVGYYIVNSLKKTN